MRILRLNQGSPEWAAHRATRCNASDAPAMLGESPHMTREQLMHRMKTGIVPETDAATQRRFDDGHAVEALLRKVAEDMLGEPLHAFVGVPDDEESLLSASFDGCTFVGDTTAECKLLNQRLRAAFADMETIAPEHRERSAAKSLPIDYRIQLEQQVRVAQADRALFLAGELRDDGTLGDTFSCWYYPDDELWKRIVSGWYQFMDDLAAYEPREPVAKIVAEPVEALPAPVVTVTGSIALKDNFKVFETKLRDWLKNTLIREPKTDEDFVNLDAQIKAMKQAREALKAAEAQMLAQVQPVDQAKKTKDMLDSLLQQNVSMAEKLLTAEKERRKGEIVAGGVAALKAHIEHLNKRLAGNYIATVPADFGGAIRGLKSLASMEDKVATELARAKIAANELADAIEVNLRTLRSHADYEFLFADLKQIVTKKPDDFQALVQSRVLAHKEEEQRRAAAAAEKERERIRAEEAAKLQRHADETARVQREEQEAAQRTQQPANQPTRAAGIPLHGAESIPANAPFKASVHEFKVAVGKPTLRLGTINERIAPLSISEAGLARLGFAAEARERGACLYHEANFPLMVEAMLAHLRAAQHEHSLEAA